MTALTFLAVPTSFSSLIQPQVSSFQYFTPSPIYSPVQEPSNNYFLLLIIDYIYEVVSNLHSKIRLPGGWNSSLYKSEASCKLFCFYPVYSSCSYPSTQTLLGNTSVKLISLFITLCWLSYPSAFLCPGNDASLFCHNGRYHEERHHIGG